MFPEKTFFQYQVVLKDGIWRDDYLGDKYGNVAQDNTWDEDDEFKGGVSTHNQYMDVLLRVGLIGVILFLNS